MSAPKLCKDCKWMRDPGEFARCEAPQNVLKINSVALVGFEDRLSFRYKFCATHRDSGWIICRLIDKTCGREGRWWKAK